MTLFFEKLQEGLQELSAAVGNPGIDLTQLWASFDKSAECERLGISPKDYCIDINGKQPLLFSQQNIRKIKYVIRILCR